MVMTQKENDTIREALMACGMECSCDADHVCDKHVKINRANIVLGSLPMDKPMEASENIPSAHYFASEIYRNYGHGKNDATDRVIAHDEAIRRKCADEADHEVFGWLVGCQRMALRAAILSAEPAQDEVQSKSVIRRTEIQRSKLEKEAEK